MRATPFTRAWTPRQLLPRQAPRRQPKTQPCAPRHEQSTTKSACALGASTGMTDVPQGGH